MPTTYAHYRFGQEVRKSLPLELQEIIDQNLTLFHFGVHGPDLLFYYQPLRKHRINRIGYACHEMTGRAFFTGAARVVNASPNREAAVSYLLGVACHFTLDRECHPYVGQKERTGASHSEIEASFDRYLMMKDGLEPLSHRVTQHLQPSELSALEIARFYPTLTRGEAYRCERSMKAHLNLLIAPPGLKRETLLACTRLAGKASIGDMLIPLAQNPKCVDSDGILFEHYQEALSLAGPMIAQLMEHVNSGAPLGDYFDHTFGET